MLCVRQKTKDLLQRLSENVSGSLQRINLAKKIVITNREKMIMVKRGYVLVSFPACGDGSKFCDRSKSIKHYLRYQQTIENSFAFLINIQNLQRTGSYSSVNEQNPVVTIAIQFS